MRRPVRAADLLEKTGVPFLADEPLGRHLTLGVGGPVPLFVRPRSAAELAAAVAILGEAGIPWRVLGAGSNVLALDEGLDFAVLATSGLDRPPEFAGSRVVAPAGAFLPRLARQAAERGLSGLEFAIGIPGSVGGALRMNAGAWGSDMSRVVTAVHAVEAGRLEESPLVPCFAYRSAGVEPLTVVTEVEISLQPAEPAAVLATLERVLAERRQTQPTAARSAGCAFRNPPGEKAGRLVDRAGLKGLARGAAQVSALHGNFILNRGGATARDVLDLVAEVKARVLETSGILLEEEVVVWGPAAEGRG